MSKNVLLAIGVVVCFFGGWRFRESVYASVEEKEQIALKFDGSLARIIGKPKPVQRTIVNANGDKQAERGVEVFVLNNSSARIERVAGTCDYDDPSMRPELRAKHKLHFTDAFPERTGVIGIDDTVYVMIKGTTEMDGSFWQNGKDLSRYTCTLIPEFNREDQLKAVAYTGRPTIR